MNDTTMLRRQESPRVEQDEEGMLRTVATPGTIGMKVGYIVGLSAVNSTRAAWKMDPSCAHCTKKVDAPANAALVIMPNRSHRIAHRGECFIMALVASNPLIVTGRPARSASPEGAQSTPRGPAL